MMSFFILIILFVVPLVIAVTVYAMNRKSPRLRRRSLLLRIAALCIFVGWLITVSIGTVVSQDNLYTQLGQASFPPDKMILLPKKKMTFEELETHRDNVIVLVTLVALSNGDNPLAVKQMHFTAQDRERHISKTWQASFLRLKLHVEFICQGFNINRIRADSRDYIFWDSNITVYTPKRGGGKGGSLIALYEDSWMDDYLLVDYNYEAASAANSVQTVKNAFHRLVWRFDPYTTDDDLKPVSISDFLSQSIDTRNIELEENPELKDTALISDEPSQYKPPSIRLFELLLPWPTLIFTIVIIIGSTAARRHILGFTACLLITLAAYVALDSYLLEDNLARITGDGNILQRTQAVRQCDTTFFFKDTAHGRLKEIADRKDLPQEVRREINFVRGNSDGVREGE